MSDVLRAQQRVEELTKELDQARAELRDAVRRAREEGESVSEMARRLGLSRTRVQQYLRE